MKSLFKPQLKKLGVSPVVAVLLLIAITITIAAFFYVYIVPVISGVKSDISRIVALQYEEIMIDDMYYKNNVLHIYVRNLSPYSVIISDVFIEYNGEIVAVFHDLNVAIQSNDVVEITLLVTLEWGKSYDVKVFTSQGAYAERKLVLLG